MNFNERLRKNMEEKGKEAAKKWQKSLETPLVTKVKKLWFVAVENLTKEDLEIIDTALFYKLRPDGYEDSNEKWINWKEDVTKEINKQLRGFDPDNLFCLLQGKEVIAWGTKVRMEEELEKLIKNLKRGNPVLYSYSILSKEGYDKRKQENKND